MVARCRPSRRAISLQLRPISIRPHKRHLSPSVRWLYLVPMATPDIAGVALGLWIYGVPNLIVPDNAKAAVIKACLYDPQVNRTYAEMAAHYDTAILPTRPRIPRDKARVEAGV